MRCWPLVKYSYSSGGLACAHACSSADMTSSKVVSTVASELCLLRPALSGRLRFVLIGVLLLYVARCARRWWLLDRQANVLLVLVDCARRR